MSLETEDKNKAKCMICWLRKDGRLFPLKELCSRAVQVWEVPVLPQDCSKPRRFCLYSFLLVGDSLYLHNPSWNFRHHSPKSRMEDRQRSSISQNLLSFPWAELSYLTMPILQTRQSTYFRCPCAQLKIGGSIWEKVDIGLGY